MSCTRSPHDDLNTAEYEDRGVEGFHVRRARLAQSAGTQRIGMSLWEVPPGQASYPYHWHIVDQELIVVLDDALSLRAPDGKWRPLAEGEVVVFPVGEDGGHQLRNGGESPARFLSISTPPAEGYDIVFYPDSDKVGVFAQTSTSSFHGIPRWATGRARRRPREPIATAQRRTRGLLGATTR
jgi:uncharacterized cupin superfamily protein